MAKFNRIYHKPLQGTQHKKPFCDSIFNLKEQLVALQLIMAQLNKEVQKVFLCPKEGQKDQ